MTDIQLGLSQHLRVVVAILLKNEKSVKSISILSAFVIILEIYKKPTRGIFDMPI
ncbi:MAG TPA: hypothetical protein VF220_00030 [Nitrososphaeraceae archaeon]